MVDTQQVEVNVDDAPSSITSLGAVLLAARNQKNLSQQDVSDSLRYSVKQVDALERDAFDLLPDAMITRGFIRNYARLLDIDAAPLLDIYRQLLPAPAPSHLAVNASMRPVLLTKNNRPWLTYIIGGLLMALFLLIAFVYLDYLPHQFKLPDNVTPSVQTSVPEEPVNTQIATEASLPLPEIALPAAEREVQDEVAPAPSESIANEVVVNLKPQTNAQVNPLNQQVVAMPALPVKPELTIKPEPKTPVSVTKKISIAVTEITWVRVNDQAGQILYEGTLNAGDTQLLNFQPPFNVTVGNAKAATVSVSGQPFDLTSHTRNNIARINLE